MPQPQNLTPLIVIKMVESYERQNDQNIAQSFLEIVQKRNYFCSSPGIRVKALCLHETVKCLALHFQNGGGR